VSRLLMQLLYASVFTCTAAFFALSEDHSLSLAVRRCKGREGCVCVCACARVHVGEK
jgi:hypothetical protein